MERLLLLANLTVTGFLTGLIWFVQVVHYPIFRKVGPGSFVPFHNAHTAWTGQVVALPMLIELGLGAWLWLQPPPALSGWANHLAFGLVLFLWGITFLAFMPMHGALARGFDPALAERLVSVNWWRTAAWTLRLGLLAFVTARLLVEA